MNINDSMLLTAMERERKGISILPFVQHKHPFQNTSTHSLPSNPPTSTTLKQQTDLPPNQPTNQPTPSRCSSPPSHSLPSQPSPPPPPSRSVLPSAHHLSTPPSAASCPFSVWPTSLALLVSLENLQTFPPGPIQLTHNSTAEPDLANVTAFKASCAAKALTAQCCLLPVVRIPDLPKSNSRVSTDILQLGLGVVCNNP